MKSKMKRSRAKHLPFAGGFKLKTKKQQLAALGDIEEGSESKCSSKWFTSLEDFSPIPRQGFQGLIMIVNFKLQ